jgi:hypothetical protein
MYVESCVFECEDFLEENQKQANKVTHIGLAKASNLLYMVLPFCCFFSYSFGHS